ISSATTTGDPAIASCTFQGGPVSRSIWYSFTPSTTGFYRVSTCATGTGSTVDDTVLGIYTSPSACAGPFTELPTDASSDGCDDDSCVTEALQSVLTTSLNAGTTYYFVVWKFDTPPPTAGNTAVQVLVESIPASANDTCADATPLTLNIPVAGFTSGVAANDYQLPAASPCFPAGHTATTAAGRDVVYSFTAPSAGQYSLRAWQYTSTGTSNVTTYASSTCPAATPGAPVTVTTCLSAANIQSSTGGEEVNCLTLTAGQQVFFYIDEVALGAGGIFYALVEACGATETEPNNTPAQANASSCGMQGQVNPATEADFFSLGTPATGSRLFAMVDSSTAGPSADVDLRVNSATDTIEFDDLDSDVEFAVSGFAPIIAGTMATGVPLFLQVDRFGAAPTGNAIPYRLYSVVQPASTATTPETEPNDSISNPTVGVNDYFSGALAGPAPSTDLDLYAFDAVAGDQIIIIVDGDPVRNNTPVDTTLELLDSAGTTLVNVNGSGAVVTLDNANPPGLFESQPAFPSEGLLFRATATGRYYARVSASTTGASGVGDYLLSISKNCAIGGGLAPTAELTLTKTDSPDPVLTGSNLTFNLTLTNAGPLAATNVTITDAVPTGTTFVSATAPAGWTTTTPAVGGTGNIQFTNPSVAAGPTAMFTIVVNVNAAGGSTITNTATVTQSTAETNTADNTAQTTTPVVVGTVVVPGNLLISEFRLRGPGGISDEFVEIYNNTNSQIIVSAQDGSAGFALAASNGVARFVIPNGTVIPARGHFLGVNSDGYSLGSYPAGNGTTATGDVTYTTEIGDNVGIALFNTSNPVNFILANRLDAVGSNTEANTLYKEGTGYPAVSTAALEYSFFRNLRSGLPQDTDNNFASAEASSVTPQNDFVFVDTAGTTTAAGQRLGAPGPENLSSPIQRNTTIKSSLIAPCVTNASPPNRVRTGSGNSGTLELRRKFTNNTGAPVTRLRFRIVDITGFPPAAGFADLRAVTSTSGSDTQPCPSGTVAFEGLTLETPPAQATGGGFNSSLAAGTITIAVPIAPGATINVNFLMNIMQAGNFRFLVNVEALP
ncbi:MAG TPA: hypothetical protein VJS64_11525, partial [Pyrinomonadaceae bacterium]|nr:hypothetical protein [Pyrinomonadaceae bacterium]